jgi:hypothetical protein
VVGVPSNFSSIHVLLLHYCRLTYTHNFTNTFQASEELADLEAANALLRQQKGVQEAAFEGFKQSMEAKVMLLEVQVSNDEIHQIESSKRHKNEQIRMTATLLMDRRSRRVATGVLRAWQVYTENNRRQVAKVKHGRVLLARNRQRRILLMWQKATQTMAQKRQVLRRMLLKLYENRLGTAMLKWRAANVREQRNEDMVGWYSNAKLRHGLMAKCMQRWSKYAKEKEDERRLTRHARAAFDRYKLARHLRAWKEHARRERVLLHLESFWKMRRTKDGAVRCLRIWLAATRLKKRMNGVLNIEGRGGGVGEGEGDDTGM